MNDWALDDEDGREVRYKFDKHEMFYNKKTTFRDIVIDY